MPADVRRNFMPPPGVVVAGVNVLAAYGSLHGRDRQTTENSSAPATTSWLDSEERGFGWGYLSAAPGEAASAAFVSLRAALLEQLDP